MRIFKTRNFTCPLISLTALSVLSFCLLFSGTASAALFLQFSGITGDSTNRIYEGWSDISDVSWGVTMSAPTGGGAASKPVLSPLSWDQTTDSSIAKLMNDITLGKRIQSAEVDFTTNGLKGPEAYFKMLFKDVVLNSLTLNGTSSGKATDSGSFSYGSIELEYYKIKPDGTLAAPVTATYNVTTNKGSVADLAGLYALGSTPPTSPVPVPAAIWLFGTGLAGLVGLKRRISRNSGV